MAFILVFVVIVITLSTLLIFSQIFKTRNSNLRLGRTEKFILNRMMSCSSNIFGNCIGVCQKIVVYPRNPVNATYSSFLEDYSFLKLDFIQNYVPVMDSMAKDYMDSKWDGFKEVKVHPLSKYFIFSLSCRIFINLTDPARVMDLALPFFAVSKEIVSHPVDFPGTLFHLAIKGSFIIREKVIEIISRRMKMEDELREGSDPKDLLGIMFVAADRNGSFLNAEKMYDKIIGYMIAGVYTTSNAITFVLNHLAEHPCVYDKVLEEQMEVLKSKAAGEMLTWEDVEKMKYSWNVVLESMRLRPPCQEGLDIPKGMKFFWRVQPTNQDPIYSLYPEKFIPSRFEDSGPRRCVPLLVGEAARMCAGKEFARMEILVYLHNVVTRFRLKKVIPNEKIIYNSESLPSQGLRMYLQAHDKC